MRRALVILAAAVTVGCGADDRKADAEPAPTATPVQLPGGGRLIFAEPERRVVAFYGHPDDPALGILGIGKPAQAAARLQKAAAGYETPRRPVLPAFELLATIAEADPGDEGLYRRRANDAVIGRYLKAARAIDAILILDIQPGRADFMTEARALERWLREPDVSLALDPEWKIGPDEVPGQVIGSVDAQEVVEVGAWLDELTAREGLPQKLLVIHQFTDDMIERRKLLRPYANVAVVLNVDGFGGQEVKVAKYDDFAAKAGFAFNGFKLFYEEDTDLMSPGEVLRLRPAPDLVVYE